MPIFEYLCDDCGTKFEKLVRRASENSAVCPSCGESHVSQQYSTFAPHANGSPKSSMQESMGSCPSGMCATPGLCGRN